MKTVTICGSMRFSEEMKKIALELETHHGFSVLQCTYNPQAITISDIEKDAIVSAHLRKIDLSDAIYVLDIDEYIGESVKEEIEYAKSKGKDVIFHTTFQS
ncbi:MAG: hypothetical protein J6C01_06050 [Lachnospiraceae bacterium]|nr:hypothetical protein [Lachnospiraceae bacterium]